MAKYQQPCRRSDFEIALICALRIEADAVEAMFDEFWDDNDEVSYGKAVGDPNAYTLGRIGKHNVVLAYMPGMGKSASASTAASFRSSFTSIRLGLVVGVCGGVPTESEGGGEILLGDVIISTGVVQFDFGRQYSHRAEMKDTLEDSLGRPNHEVRAFLQKLNAKRSRAQLKENSSKYLAALCDKEDFRTSKYPGANEDVLFPPTYRHKHRQQSSCSVCAKCHGAEDVVCDVALTSSCAELKCEEARQIMRDRLEKIKASIAIEHYAVAAKPEVHFGRIASGDLVMKSGYHRDGIATKKKVIAFEMEGAGVWDNFPTVVIKGVCDYADSHKNKKWQNYAAAVAAAFMKAFLKEWSGATIACRNPRPVFTVPFRRDPDFVNRGDILKQIDERCSQPAGRVALVGLGGVGKSQLAIEYAHRVKQKSPEKRVFWIYASNKARVEAAYKDIADRLLLRGRDDRTASVLGLVVKWLSDETNGPWLMIVDNADEFGMIAGQGAGSEEGYSVASLLPQSDNGAVLITSRNIDVARELTGREKDIIHVETMNQHEATKLLENKLREPPDNSTVDLLAALDYFPLAIIQAASYINRQPRMPISDYIRRFRIIESKTRLLKKAAADMRRDEKASNSILTTWQISFEQIRSDRREEDGEYYEDIALLYSFSLITKPNEEEFGMHGLVQFATRVWLSSTGVEEDFWGKFVAVMAEAFGSEEYKNWRLCRALLPHIQSITEKRPSHIEQGEDWTRLVTNAGGYAWKQRLFLQAEELIHQSLEECERWSFMAWSEPMIQRNLQILASILIDQGRYEEAKMSAQRVTTVLLKRKKVHGEDHPETVANLNNLAQVLNQQEKYEEAEEIGRRALVVNEKELGEDHIDTLTSLNHLGNALSCQGKYEESQMMYRRELVGKEKVLGTNHPDTMTSMHNVGMALCCQGESEEAEELLRRVVAGRGKELGEDHPNTLTSLHYLARLLTGQGKDEEAEEIERRALAGMEKNLGKDHQDTLESLHNLGVVLASQGKYTEAVDIKRRALAEAEKKLGDDHPNILENVWSLAYFLEKIEHYDESVWLYKRACAGFERQLGAFHPSTVECRQELATLLSKMPD
ncbi:purine and uridine phosphorylase [Rhizodiscina lignyota]|uniref:Purine and uridine phosphorylase n=1 Tax=Rhizodiscina lignyota TaxID=1504668 RepID=A0A9P4MBE4_9PEZI|nr:purine and uridine phosphorylase [Rhizodiscina lignyota]